jgi:hypothetical protein
MAFVKGSARLTRMACDATALITACIDWFRGADLQWRQDAFVNEIGMIRALFALTGRRHVAWRRRQRTKRR